MPTAGILRRVTGFFVGFGRSGGALSRDWSCPVHWLSIGRVSISWCLCSVALSALRTLGRMRGRGAAAGFCGSGPMTTGEAGVRSCAELVEARSPALNADTARAETQSLNGAFPAERELAGAWLSAGATVVRRG